MTEDVKKEAPSQEGENAKPEQDTVSKLFEVRDKRPDLPKAAESKESKELAESKGKAPKKPEIASNADDEGNEASTGSKADPENKENDQDAPSEVELLRKKLAKSEKMILDNQRYGHRNAQKVRNAFKAAQQLVEDGALAEDEAKGILEALNFEGEDDAPVPPAHRFAPIFKVANQELQNIKKYTDDGLLQDKVDAFDYFLSIASEEEKEELLESLTALMDNPLNLAKKMLAIGQEVFENSYGQVKKAGGLKNYLSQKDQELEKLQKNIDKLTKKLAQYEDFDQPRHRIDEMGDRDGGVPAKDTISNLFDERDRARQR